ncbi:WavQ [Vibrio sp. L3-7]|uniref:WavQ n=1 Tax=Vibrio sp. L3-7 TaxID=2912253 RepID=UPI0011944AB8|nr:WavQ [Vibrio sp. L3-7]MCF7504175.1 WavQ [Vibrio sp. L3-7]TVU75425.1 WavQ [Vibrio tasmaniensis]
MKFYIYAPSYNANSGGCVVLHKLVHIINTETKHEAFLVPRVFERFQVGSIKTLLRNFKIYLFLKKEGFSYKNNENFETPIRRVISKDDLLDSIIVYPEITSGNPLNAKNVVRWFLHQPGHFTNEVNYSPGELYYKFNSAIKNFELYKSKLSTSELKVIHYPTDIYNNDLCDTERAGVCYMVRKGGHKSKIHDSNAICIDGMEHHKIAEVFKRSKKFISYDDYTAYSIFANLCGCESIVVPDENVTKEQWYPLESDRYGIAYGTSEEELTWANETRPKVLEHVDLEHRRSIDNVKGFVQESIEYFNL